jgi:hypothetical protein
MLYFFKSALPRSLVKQSYGLEDASWKRNIKISPMDYKPQGRSTWIRFKERFTTIESHGLGHI